MLVFPGNTYGQRLSYVAIAVNTTLNPLSLGYEEGLPIYRDWENFVNNKVCAVCNPSRRTKETTLMSRWTKTSEVTFGFEWWEDVSNATELDEHRQFVI